MELLGCHWDMPPTHEICHQPAMVPPARHACHRTNMIQYACHQPTIGMPPTHNACHQPTLGRLGGYATNSCLWYATNPLWYILPQGRPKNPETLPCCRNLERGWKGSYNLGLVVLALGDWCYTTWVCSCWPVIKAVVVKRLGLKTVINKKRKSHLLYQVGLGAFGGSCTNNFWPILALVFLKAGSWSKELSHSIWPQIAAASWSDACWPFATTIKTMGFWFWPVVW